MDKRRRNHPRKVLSKKNSSSRKVMMGGKKDNDDDTKIFSARGTVIELAGNDGKLLMDGHGWIPKTDIRFCFSGIARKTNKKNSTGNANKSLPMGGSSAPPKSSMPSVHLKGFSAARSCRRLSTPTRLKTSSQRPKYTPNTSGSRLPQTQNTSMSTNYSHRQRNRSSQQEENSSISNPQSPSSMKTPPQSPSAMKTPPQLSSMIISNQTPDFRTPTGSSSTSQPYRTPPMQQLSSSLQKNRSITSSGPHHGRAKSLGLSRGIPVQSYPMKPGNAMAVKGAKRMKFHAQGTLRFINHDTFEIYGEGSVIGGGTSFEFKGMIDTDAEKSAEGDPSSNSYLINNNRRRPKSVPQSSKIPASTQSIPTVFYIPSHPPEPHQTDLIQPVSTGNHSCNNETTLAGFAHRTDPNIVADQRKSSSDSGPHEVFQTPRSPIGMMPRSPVSVPFKTPSGSSTNKERPSTPNNGGMKDQGPLTSQAKSPLFTTPPQLLTPKFETPKSSPDQHNQMQKRSKRQGSREPSGSPRSVPSAGGSNRQRLFETSESPQSVPSAGGSNRQRLIGTSESPSGVRAAKSCQQRLFATPESPDLPNVVKKSRRSPQSQQSSSSQSNSQVRKGSVNSQKQNNRKPKSVSSRRHSPKNGLSPSSYARQDLRLRSQSCPPSFSEDSGTGLFRIHFHDPSDQIEALQPKPIDATAGVRRSNSRSSKSSSPHSCSGAGIKLRNQSQSKVEAHRSQSCPPSFSEDSGTGLFRIHFHDPSDQIAALQPKPIDATAGVRRSNSRSSKSSSPHSCSGAGIKLRNQSQSKAAAAAVAVATDCVLSQQSLSTKRGVLPQQSPTSQCKAVGQQSASTPCSVVPLQPPSTRCVVLPQESPSSQCKVVPQQSASTPCSVLPQQPPSTQCNILPEQPRITRSSILKHQQKYQQQRQQPQKTGSSNTTNNIKSENGGGGAGGAGGGPLTRGGVIRRQQQYHQQREQYQQQQQQQYQQQQQKQQNIASTSNSRSLNDDAGSVGRGSIGHHYNLRSRRSIIPSSHHETNATQASSTQSTHPQSRSCRTAVYDGNVVVGSSRSTRPDRGRTAATAATTYRKSTYTATTSTARQQQQEACSMPSGSGRPDQPIETNAGLAFPVNKIRHVMEEHLTLIGEKQPHQTNKPHKITIEDDVAIHMTALIEFLVATLLIEAGNESKSLGHDQIEAAVILDTMRNESEFSQIVRNFQINPVV